MKSKTLRKKFSTGPHEFTMKEWIGCAPFEKLLKMEILEAAEGKAILRMPFMLKLAQGAGLMRGGALVSLADTAVAMAIKSLLPANSHFATISLETKFLRPVKKGNVTAKAKVASKRRRYLRGRAVVLDDEGREILDFTSQFKIASDTKIRGVNFKHHLSGD